MRLPSAGAAPITRVMACHDWLGESFLWDDRRGEVCWVNIHDGEVWRYRPSDGTSWRHQLLERVRAIGLRAAGGLVVGLASGFALYDPQTEVLETVGTVEAEHPTTRLNDGRVDRQG